jgi:cardiolipin synthase (CMP-forming)
MTEPAATETDRIWTIPNALSVLRLLGVPLFLWLLLGPHQDGWALVILAVSGFTDWLDGVLARKLNQMSRFGALLDPLADRLYILATMVGLVLRHVIPWWLAALIIGRDVIVGLALPVLRKAGYGPPEVHYLGKAATFCLLYAFPLLLIGTYSGTAADIAQPAAWAFTIWGTALYVYAGVVYLAQAVGIVRTARA